MKARLGRRYRDRITGFEGIATSAHEYLQGCRRITLERLNEKGEEILQITFDEPNLTAVEGGLPEPEWSRTTRAGGPHDHDAITDTHR